MISLLNFIDTGFIITLGLLLLISGAVMLYCYRRLNVLENSVIEHGKILQNFIMNYNNQVFMSQQNQYGGLDNPQMPHGDVGEVATYNEEEKISVSDDDESGDESDDESDGETDDESDGGSESDDDEDAIVELVPDDVKTKILNVIENVEIKEALFDGIKMLDEPSVVDINDPFTNNLPVDLLELDLEHLAPKLPEPVDAPVSETNEKKNYTRQKVDELRALVVSKNLIDNEAAQNMKKNDLLKLLQ
jgi:hypothetical protein